jgi:dihydrofolate reductase
MVRTRTHREARMTRYRFYTATTLDGFLADRHDSLDWLLSQPIDEKGPFNFPDFMTGIGVQVMGATTYQWVVDHHVIAEGKSWPYADRATFVFTHRPIDVVDPSISVVSGPPGTHRTALEAAAGTRDVWVVGGGDLAAQFADAGMLDEVVLNYAPVLLGAGRPLFTRPFDLELMESARNRAFLMARYRVLGPRA